MLTVLRRVDNRGYNANDINATTLGVQLSQAIPNGLQLAEGKFTIGGGTNSVAHFNDNTLGIDDEVTWVKGHHQIVFGGEFVRNQLNITTDTSRTVPLPSTGNSAAAARTAATGYGDQTLDFLEGALSAFEQSKFQQNALAWQSFPACILQDTFHATPALTMVAGIRWSPEFEPDRLLNRGVVFNHDAFLANKVSTVYPNAPAGAMYYGDPGVPTGLHAELHLAVLSPNVGVASVTQTDRGNGRYRGGAELIYDEVNFFTSQRNQQNPPYATAIKQTQTSTSGPMNFSAPWTVGSQTVKPISHNQQIPTPAIAQFFAQSQYIVDPVDTIRPTPCNGRSASSISSAMDGRHRWTTSATRPRTYPWACRSVRRYSPPAIGAAGGTGCGPVVTTGPAGKVGYCGNGMFNHSECEATLSPDRAKPDSREYVLGRRRRIRAGQR